MGKSIVIGVTSGIAAYKTLELISSLQKDGINITVILSKNAEKMVPLAEFKKVTDKVYTSLFEDEFRYQDVLSKRKVRHIEIADNADLFVIIPATANLIAKVSLGIADDLLTTTLLATLAPIIICPAMNVHMWENPIVKTNVERLRKQGFILLGPEHGMLACEYTGMGRLIEIETVKKEILSYLHKATLLSGKKFLVTAGGTKEPIDAVRVLTNKGSGKMGAAIVDVLKKMGADVMLLRAVDAVKPRSSVTEELFETADDLDVLIKKHAKNYDYCFHTAAISDFIVDNKSDEKIKSNSAHIIKLHPRRKISESIKEINPQIKLILFKAEVDKTENELRALAQKKLEETSVYAVVANEVGKNDRGFLADTNEVTIVTKKGVKHIPLNTKAIIAREIVTYLLEESFLFV